MAKGQVSALPEAHTLSRFTFDYELKRDAAFAPPPAMEDLQDTVPLDLQQGVSVYFSVVEHRTPTFGALADFAALSVPANEPHRFLGRARRDAEIAVADSNRFAKFLGLAFMYEFAGSTWFAPVQRLLGRTLPFGRNRALRVKKQHKGDGPDYLGAAFDPVKARGNALHAIEFKGRSGGRVKLEHNVFSTWEQQAENLRLETTERRLFPIKSWVVASNFAFAEATSGRKKSALLVSDPIAPTGGRFDGENDSLLAEPVIREHIARQCRVLGFQSLAAGVSTGTALDRDTPEATPYVFKLRDPNTRERRYIGNFYIVSPRGDLVPAPDGFGVPWGLLAGRADIEIEGFGPHGIHVRFRGGARPGHHIDIHIHGSPSGVSDRRVREAIYNFLSGGRRIFLGQDATMVRDCLASPRGVLPRGRSFEEEFTLSVQGADFERLSDEGERGPLRVLRNGAVFASADMVEPGEDDFWARTE